MQRVARVRQRQLSYLLVLIYVPRHEKSVSHEQQLEEASTHKNAKTCRYFLCLVPRDLDL